VLAIVMAHIAADIKVVHAGGGGGGLRGERRKRSKTILAVLAIVAVAVLALVSFTVVEEKRLVMLREASLTVAAVITATAARALTLITFMAVEEFLAYKGAVAHSSSDTLIAFVADIPHLAGTVLVSVSQADSIRFVVHVRSIN
jgi:hypothetical protein